MELRQISDDFFTIGNIAILYKKTENDVYDFNFRMVIEMAEAGGFRMMIKEEKTCQMQFIFPKLNIEK